jgi:succinate-semialdehyde dehydrogenase/glutarate-semialdehyde dehydrogenase
LVTAAEEAAAVAAAPRRILIGGAWRDANGGRTFPVEDPSSGEVLAEVADASAADAISALDAACMASPGWARQAPRDRADVLYRAHRAVHAAQDELALLVTLENGKPLEQSRDEVLYAAEYLRWYAEEAVRVEGCYQTSPDGRGRMLLMRQPIGPTLSVLPWNWPLVMAARDLGPALAAGCAMVLKPAPEAPLSCLAFSRIVQEQGLPNGSSTRFRPRGRGRW